MLEENDLIDSHTSSSLGQPIDEHPLLQKMREIVATRSATINNSESKLKDKQNNKVGDHHKLAEN